MPRAGHRRSGGSARETTRRAKRAEARQSACEARRGPVERLQRDAGNFSTRPDAERRVESKKADGPRGPPTCNEPGDKELHGRRHPLPNSMFLPVLR